MRTCHHSIQLIHLHHYLRDLRGKFTLLLRNNLALLCPAGLTFFSTLSLAVYLTTTLTRCPGTAITLRTVPVPINS